jgi:GNAT superfamily N-acetyltransferase
MRSTRAVAPCDLDLICRHRHEMFKVSGRTDAMLAEMSEGFRVWLKPRLEDGRYFGWMIEEHGQVIVGLGMMIVDWPPHPSHPGEAARGYVLNMFVEPAHRRAGLGKQLMLLAQDEAARRNVTFMVLHATAQGRGLYEQLGWKQTSEMSLTVAPKGETAS